MSSNQLSWSMDSSAWHGNSSTSYHSAQRFAGGTRNDSSEHLMFHDANSLPGRNLPCISSSFEPLILWAHFIRAANQEGTIKRTPTFIAQIVSGECEPVNSTVRYALKRETGESEGSEIRGGRLEYGEGSSVRFTWILQGFAMGLVGLKGTTVV